MSKENLFDSLTRLAGSGMPRRRMLKLAMGSMAAATFGRSAFATCNGGTTSTGHCCPSPKVLDPAKNCCSSSEIDAAGYCCNPSDGRHLDPNGNCCAQFDQYGYCVDKFPGCTAATCGNFVPCSASNSDCVCGSVANGGGFCVPGSTPCAGLPTCTTNNDCASGSICLVNTCCGAGVCVSTALECAATSAAPKSKTSGPTIAHR